MFLTLLLTSISIALFGQEVALMNTIAYTGLKAKSSACTNWKMIYSAGPYEVSYCPNINDPKSTSWKTVIYFKSSFPESTYLILHADVRHKDGDFLANQRIASGTLYRGNNFEDYSLSDYVSFQNERIKYLKIGGRIIYDDFQRK